MALSNKSYIGTRDFFPPELRKQQWLFEKQRKVCRSFGYQEYGAPLLEELKLYQEKASAEILHEQSYSFRDKGGRELIIRPEMTPTLARMLSQRIRDLPAPVRWFSIANFMRYERPGHGRLREFFQLNVDLVGAAGASANAEILSLLMELFFAYGARPGDFLIRYSDRRFLESYLQMQDQERWRRALRVIDKRSKLKQEEFEQQLSQCCSKEESGKLQDFFCMTRADMASLSSRGLIDTQAVQELVELESILRDQGYDQSSLRFDPALARGFDYYTGFIFEVYDQKANTANKRALCGGGRYDNLLGLFAKESTAAVGFGMGDLTLEHFLAEHQLIPAELGEERGIFVVLMQEELRGACLRLARELRQNGIDIEIEQALHPTKKLGQQLSLAQKKGRRFVLILGDEELESQSVSIKDLKSGKQEKVPVATALSKVLEWQGLSSS